tara:strand:- start:31 stop:522 length:492 start_codon:yes stop_codon:yes gene_type:complete
MEEFRDVKGYEGLYQVSDLGNVKSLKRKNVPKDRILKTSLSAGYKRVALFKNHIGKDFRIHQLLAITFLNHKPDGTNKLVVDHRDNNPLNNDLSNLQIITNRENIVKNNKKGISSFVGVSFRSERKRNWMSRIQVNGKRKTLGYFDTELQAAEAYQTALKEIL